jgi:hypothetical protein
MAIKVRDTPSWALKLGSKSDVGSIDTQTSHIETMPLHEFTTIFHVLAVSKHKLDWFTVFTSGLAGGA